MDRVDFVQVTSKHYDTTLCCELSTIGNLRSYFGDAEDNVD